MSKVNTGRIVCTDGVATSSDNSPAFDAFVSASLRRYMQGDWGDTCPEDAEQNEIPDQRILAVYNLPLPLQRPKPGSVGINDRDGSTVDSIWIITEWDRSVTTILFSSEY